MIRLPSLGVVAQFSDNSVQLIASEQKETIELFRNNLGRSEFYLPLMTQRVRRRAKLVELLGPSRNVTSEFLLRADDK